LLCFLELEAALTVLSWHCPYFNRRYTPW